MVELHSVCAIKLTTLQTAFYQTKECFFYKCLFSFAQSQTLKNSADCWSMKSILVSLQWHDLYFECRVCIFGHRQGTDKLCYCCVSCAVPRKIWIRSFGLLVNRSLSHSAAMSLWSLLEFVLNVVFFFLSTVYLQL